MTITVYINQNPAGELTISQAGLYTIMEANANAEGLIRLWVHGGGKSAYLGIMEPKNGGLYLYRRFTRRQLAAFPDPVKFASDQEQDDLHNEVNINNDADRMPTIADESEPSSADVSRAGPEADGQPKGETDCRSCPWPAEMPEEGLLWYRRPDGSLVSHDGISSLLAIPAELRTADRRMTERVIEGKKYLVFRY